MQVLQHCSLSPSALHMVPRSTRPQNLLVSWQGSTSLPSLEGETTMLGSGPQSRRQGGPKHWRVAAGLDSWEEHSESGARPPASHSQDTERDWEPLSQEAEHWGGEVGGGEKGEGGGGGGEEGEEEEREVCYLRPLPQDPYPLALCVQTGL